MSSSGKRGSFRRQAHTTIQRNYSMPLCKSHAAPCSTRPPLMNDSRCRVPQMAGILLPFVELTNNSLGHYYTRKAAYIWLKPSHSFDKEELFGYTRYSRPFQLGVDAKSGVDNSADLLESYISYKN